MVALEVKAFLEEVGLRGAKNLPLNHYVLLRNKEEPTHGVPARHVGDGEFRVEFNGLAVTGDGLVHLRLFGQGGAEVVTG